MRIEDARQSIDSGITQLRSVLMFAYYFPPCICWPTASARAEGLAKGLAVNGWSPIVVTRKNGCQCLDGDHVDRGGVSVRPALPALEVRRITVRMTSIMRLRGWADHRSESGTGRPLAVPLRKLLTTLLVLADGRNDWVGAASSEGNRLFRERHVDAVWTTAPPYRAVHIGRRLQRRHHTPWVADLRDSIARSYSLGSIRRAGRRLARPIRSLPRYLWMRDLRRASAVICVSPQEAELDEAALGRNVDSLPSGFDRSTWQDLRSETAQRASNNDSFRVLYAGNLLSHVQDPEPFFSGLRLFLESERATPAISFAYVGPSGPQVRVRVDSHGVGSVFDELGMVPVRQARTLMCEADLLLILCAANGRSGIPGGKLYEYLAAGPPILAVPATDRFVLNLLHETGAGETASTPDEIAEVLSRRHEEWRTERVERRSLEDLSRFTWAARGRQLANLLDELRAGSS